MSCTNLSTAVSSCDRLRRSLASGHGPKRKCMSGSPISCEVGMLAKEEAELVRERQSAPSRLFAAGGRSSRWETTNSTVGAGLQVLRAPQRDVSTTCRGPGSSKHIPWCLALRQINDYGLVLVNFFRSAQIGRGH